MRENVPLVAPTTHVDILLKDRVVVPVHALVPTAQEEKSPSPGGGADVGGGGAEGIVINIRPSVRPSPRRQNRTMENGHAAWRSPSSSSAATVRRYRRPSDRARVARGSGVEYVRKHARSQSVSRARVSACIYVCVVHLHSSYLLNVFIGSRKEETAASCVPTANHPLFILPQRSSRGCQSGSPSLLLRAHFASRVFMFRI